MKPWTEQELDFIERNKDKIESGDFGKIVDGIDPNVILPLLVEGRILGGILNILGSEDFFKKLGKDRFEFNLFQYSDTLPDKVIIPNGCLDLPAGMFRFSNIKEVVLPSTLETIDNGCFEGSSLTRVEFPKYFSDINPGSFNRCADLGEVIFNDNLQFICIGAFQGCVSLKEVAISSCIEIQENGFRDCKGLEKVVIGECENLHHNAFGHCDNLKVIKMNNISKIYGDPFESHNKDLVIIFDGETYTPEDFCDWVKIKMRSYK